MTSNWKICESRFHIHFWKAVMSLDWDIPWISPSVSEFFINQTWVLLSWSFFDAALIFSHIYPLTDLHHQCLRNSKIQFQKSFVTAPYLQSIGKFFFQDFILFELAWKTKELFLAVLFIVITPRSVNFYPANYLTMVWKWVGYVLQNLEHVQYFGADRIYSPLCLFLGSHET